MKKYQILIYLLYSVERFVSCGDKHVGFWRRVALRGLGIAERTEKRRRQIKKKNNRKKKKKEGGVEEERQKEGVREKRARGSVDTKKRGEVQRGERVQMGKEATG
jgi:hypothetical protein